jgi:CHAT domain-containing protein
LIPDRPARRLARDGVSLAIGFFFALLAGCGTESANGATRSSRITREILADRFAIGRLAGQTDWRACARADSSATLTCSSLSTTTKAFNRLASASRAAKQRLDSDSSVDALRDAALLSLRLRDSVKTGLDDAARLLARARRVAPKNATILNDFAVVQLEIGERDQTVRPYLTALDAIERSLAVDSSSTVTLFNRALVLERLHLLATAEHAWERYVSVERDRAWRREAQTHVARVASELNSAMLPQGGRNDVFALLGDWGHAIESHDERRASSALAAVHRVVATLDTVHGDQSLRFTVALVDSEVQAAKRSVTARKTLERLARAHADLGDGFGPYLRGMYDQASDPLQRAERELHALGSTAGGWASLYLASTELNQNRFDAADERLQRIIAETTPLQPALAGKAVWTRGVMESRRGNFESSNRYYVAAEPHMARANEPENEGAISYLIAESLGLAGQNSAGQSEAYRGMRLLAPYRKSPFLNNHLWAIASYARADSMPYAALAVMDEVLSVAVSLGSPAPVALTYRARARDLVAVGQRDSAVSELTTALRTIEPLTGNAKDGYRAGIQLVQGQILRADDPRGARRLLEQVAKEYRRLGAGSETSVAFYETAMAARDAGDSADARAFLGESIAQIEHQQAAVESSEGRAALFETADNAFDAMIDLQLAAGHPDSAFLYLERERAAAKFTPTTAASNARSSGPPSLAELRGHLPSDMLFIEYALLKERAIAWTVSRNGIRSYVIPVPRDTIAQLVQRFLKEASIPTAREGDARSTLFDVLLRPLAGDLVAVKQVSIVGDRELSRLPFAALWDRDWQRYVVEGYGVRTEPSAAFFLAALSVAQVKHQRRTALVIGNPAIDSAVRLDPLPGAEREAQRVAGLYQNAVLLTDAAARRDTILTLLQTANVFHFAGHAVFAGDRPELSFLALASARTGAEAGELTAREIAQLRLSNLELVVLSACQTLNARSSRTGAVAGLAASFLRAGVPAIVSTLYDVSDDLTGSLLSGFHQRLAAGLPASDALREAQLDALKSRSGQQAAPAIWAAFVYAGP